MASYTIKQGDHLAKVARQFGFRHWETVWKAGENADLRAKRPDPNVLYPGDVLFIPEKQDKEESKPTAKQHRFRVKISKIKLRIVVRDFDNLPLTNTECKLEVEGAVYPLTTDGKGQIEQLIPESAENGKLAIPDLDFELPLHIGHLDPVDIDTGWKARLINLGYHWGTLDDDKEDLRLSWALEEFQCDYSVTITGKPDAATRAKLKEVYGS
jgi:N-acetylmuramoyl-L-alanine amidase